MLVHRLAEKAEVLVSRGANANERDRAQMRGLKYLTERKDVEGATAKVGDKLNEPVAISSADGVTYNSNSKRNWKVRDANGDALSRRPRS